MKPTPNGRDQRSNPASLEELGKYLEDRAQKELEQARKDGAEPLVGPFRILLKEFFNSSPSWFFQLCQKTIRRQIPPPKDWDFLLSEQNSPFQNLLKWAQRLELWPYLKAHLLCVQAAADPLFWPEMGKVSGPALEKIRENTELSRGFLHLLAAALCDRPLPVKSESQPVLLVQDQGILADLFLMVVTPGEGKWHPAPAVSLLPVDASFRAGREAASDCVTKRFGWELGNRDVCWELRFRGSEWPAEVKGPSASAAMGLLLAKLLAPSHGRASR